MARSALVLTVDRLSAAQLGPYGGTSASTPNFNRLAAQSLLVEHAISDSPDLARVFRSCWCGVHAGAPAEGPATASVVQALASSVSTVLVTDDPALAALPLAENFAERIVLPAKETNTLAAALDETQIAQTLAAAVDVLVNLRSPFLLWIHLQGLAAPWDAPLELRESLRGDDDPPPRSEAQVPSLVLHTDYDPDLLLGIAQACAAQVMLLDMALGALLEAIDAHATRDELLFLLTSPRGFPLGEHLHVGDAATALYGELLHVPLLVRRGDGAGGLAREQALAQPADIAATLADWFGLPWAGPSPQAASLLALAADAPPVWPRAQTLSISAGERATRTAAWFLRQQGAAAELFSKPDDRFEANEVSSLCPAIVEQLASAAAALERALAASNFEHLPPLSPELIRG